MKKKIDPQIIRTRGSGRGRTIRNPADLDSLALQQAQAEAIANVELLELTTGAHEHRGIGQDSIHVAKEQPDLAETGGQGGER